MKKILVLLPVIIIIVVLLFFRGGFGFGTGNGKRNGDRNTSAYEEQTDASINESEEKEAVDSGNDNNEAKEKTIKISVAGNDYFYENEKIELDSLLQKISEFDGNYVVEVKDEQASKNAYEALIKALEEKGIAYIEK